MPTPLETEARETYARFVAARDEVDVVLGARSPTSSPKTPSTSTPPGAASRAARTSATSSSRSMAGLTGYGWSTPENWTLCEGPRLVSQWDQILGHKPDGTPWLVAGLSILYYAGGGRFCYSHDMLNMTHVGETLKAMEWKPPGVFNMPPRKPNRDISLPKAWAHLEKSRAR